MHSPFMEDGLVVEISIRRRTTGHEEMKEKGKHLLLFMRKQKK